MPYSTLTCERHEAFTLQMQEMQSEIYTDGITDGYEGNRPKHVDINYLQGYADGTRAKLVEVQAELHLLKTDSDRYFQIYNAPDDF